MVALLLEVEKANNNACFNPEKKKLFLFLLLILLTKYIQQKDELIIQ